MPVAKPTLVVVDTNCFIRLLFSTLRPVLGATFGGYQLVTLVELAAECGPDTEVAQRHPWLQDPAVQAELLANCLKLREPKKTKAQEHSRYFRREGNAVLRKHCEKHQIELVRELSLADAKALGAAQAINAVLATDEWPLALVAGEVSDVPAVWTSLTIIHLMEADGKISREQRVQVVADWLKHGEKLPQEWRVQYRALFNEAPPDGQA